MAGSHCGPESGSLVQATRAMGGPSCDPGPPPTTHTDPSGSPLPPPEHGCTHLWQMTPWFRHPARSRRKSCEHLECENPVLLQCAICASLLAKRCGSGRESRCVPCAGRKRRDVARIGRSGWMTDRPIDVAAFVTLTAPGVKGTRNGRHAIRWDTTRCVHGPGTKCSGDIGCVGHPDDLARWHATLGQRWSWFMTDLRRTLDRHYPGVDVQFFKAAEPQKREVAHFHVMMRLEGAALTQKRLHALMRLLADRHGFGRQCAVDYVSLRDPLGIARAAGYCAKYATKSADAFAETRMLDESTGELRDGRLRSWSASRRWGSTMKALRQERIDWAREELLRPSVVPCGSTVDGGTLGAAGALDLDCHNYASGIGGLIRIAPRGTAPV